MTVMTGVTGEYTTLDTQFRLKLHRCPRALAWHGRNLSWPVG